LGKVESIEASGVEKQKVKVSLNIHTHTHTHAHTQIFLARNNLILRY